MGAALTRCRAANLTLPRVWNDPVPHNAVQQYSKLCMANRLRLEFEQQTGVIHELVVRARFDLIFRGARASPVRCAVPRTALA